MTVRQIYENSLTELNKLQAPSLLLEDFIYFINKAIINYVDVQYKLYALNQEVTDALNVLTETQISDVTLNTSNNPLQKDSYFVTLNRDYFRLLSCVCEFKPVGGSNCDHDGTIYEKAKRFTSDMYTTLNNYYLKPSYKRPYFYFHNSGVNQLDTNPSAQVPVKQQGVSYNNYSDIIMEVKAGDKKKYILTKVVIDYLKYPAYVTITQDQIDQEQDTSQVLEFSDRDCLEIIKELTKLTLENLSDNRLQTNIAVNQKDMSSLQQVTKMR